ncbi:unnamed protein product [Clonostachys rosea]|uniref:Heterokaryon incompatibility domain-containing protein n=1 Tax=Bionectria ochroleuca TaxID=29856 RepID=A0ABY6UIX5_BIOOC|nr:unnamed protein product [Clonostachys rosea]
MGVLHYVKPAYLVRVTVSLSGGSNSSIPLLDVPDAEDQAWDFLEHFGVLVKVKAGNLVTRLEHLKHTVFAATDVAELYKQIQSCLSEEDLGFIRQRFQQSELVYIPADAVKDTQESRWVALDSCVWDGPKCLEKTPCLIKYYDDQADFFCDSLRLNVADLKAVIREVKLINLTDSLSYIQSLLMQLSHMLYGTTYSTRFDAHFEDLAELEIFPVWTGRSGPDFDSLRSASMTDNNAWWYIADFRHLIDAFENRVPLLAVEPHMLEGMKDLISSMRWQNRKLHTIATMNVASGGALLVPVSKPDRAEVIKHLRSVQILEAEDVRVTWQFENNLGKTITGQMEKGRVMITTNGSTLSISMVKEDMKVGCPPLELTEELSKFCGIKRSRYLRLLGHILTQSDTRRINMDLDRWDVPQLESDFDDSEIDTQPIVPKIRDTSHEPSTASPPPNPPKPQNLARSGRQKLAAGWQQALYGNNAPHQKGLGSPKDGDTASSKAKKERSQKDGAEGEKASETTKSKRKSANTRIKNVEETKATNSEAPSRQEKPRSSTQKAPLKAVKAEVDSGVDDPPSSSTLLNSSSLPSQVRDQLQDARPGRPKRGIGRKYGNQGLMSLSMPVISASRDSQVEENQFIAELYADLSKVEGALRNILGSDFARRLSIDYRDSRKEQTELFVLAVVYNILDDPEVALYADPWRLHAMGLLSLESFHDQEGWFSSGTPAVYISNSQIPESIADAEELGKRYKYKHLKTKEIRILDLFLSEDETLRGIIRHVPLSEAGAFTAVSYVWGTPVTEIHGCYLETPHGNLVLTFSLHSALQALRKRSRSILPIWADGICINQDDPREKALQIEMMGQIFQAAEQVAAWLGHEFNGSQEAMDALSKIRPRIEPSIHNSADSASRASTTGVTSQDNELAAEASVYEDLPWQYINALLERSWFRRVWITQEVVLPSQVTVMCGQSEMDWDDLCDALTCCESKANQGLSPNSEDLRLLPAAGPVYALGAARRRLRTGGHRHSLLRWFELFAHTNASVEVDKLFAFLGLARDGDFEDFRPDYESSLEEVLRRFARGFLMQGQVMELLYRAGASKSYQFCSWIPRWTAGEFPKTISTWEGCEGLFFAGPQVAPTLSVAGAQIPQCVVLDGYIVDTVQKRHSIRWGSDTSFSFFDAMIDFHTLLSYLQDYPTGETLDDVLFQLPIGCAARPHLESNLDHLRALRPFMADKQGEWPSDLRQLVLSVGYSRDPAQYWDLPQASRIAIERYWQTARAFSRRLGTAAVGFTQGRGEGSFRNRNAMSYL